MILNSICDEEEEEETPLHLRAARGRSDPTRHLALDNPEKPIDNIDEYVFLLSYLNFK